MIVAIPRTVASALVFAFLVGTAPLRAEYAWWVTADFRPGDSTIAFIPIHDLDKDWVSASVLRDQDLPPAASVPGETLKEHGAALQIDGDLNGDGRSDKALVGVYRGRRGNTGAFLLVLTRTATGRWTKAALFKSPGRPRFSAII